MSEWRSVETDGYPKQGLIVNVYRPLVHCVDRAYWTGRWIEDSRDDRFDGTEIGGISHWREMERVIPPPFSVAEDLRARVFAEAALVEAAKTKPAGGAR